MSKFTRILPDGEGGYRVFENWTTGNDTFMKIFPLLLVIPLILFFGLISPLIFWLLIPLSYVKDNHENTIWALVISFLIFLDFTFGGIVWMAFNLNKLFTAFYFFGALQIVSVIINLVRLYLYTKRDGELPIVLVFGIFIILMYFGYDMFSHIAEVTSSDTPLFWFEEWYNKEVAAAAESGRYDY